MRTTVASVAARLLVAASAADARITMLTFVERLSPAFGGYSFAAVG
jgi:hypothetical protein